MRTVWSSQLIDCEENKETITIIAMHDSMARDGLADGIKNNLIQT